MAAPAPVAAPARAAPPPVPQHAAPSEHDEQERRADAGHSFAKIAVTAPLPPPVEAVRKRAAAAARAAKAHHPADATAASLAPAAQKKRMPESKQAQADADHAAKLVDAANLVDAPHGKFDQTEFKRDVQERVAKMAPSQDDDDSPAEQAKKGELENAKTTTEIKRRVTTSATAAQREIADRNAQPTNPVTPVLPDAADLPGDAPAVRLPAISAAKVVPPPRPASDLDFSADQKTVDAALAPDGVTLKQVQEGNEPRFQKFLDSRQKVVAFVRTGPAEARASEQRALSALAADATASEQAARGKLGADRRAGVGAVHRTIETAKSHDQHAFEKAVKAADLVLEVTRGLVKSELDALVPRVEQEFSRREAKARANFDKQLELDIEQDRQDRSLLGTIWDHTPFVHAKQHRLEKLFDEQKQNYLAMMDGALDAIATMIAETFDRVMWFIATGRQAVDNLLGPKLGLRGELNQKRLDARERLESGFADLVGDVDSTRDQLVDDVAHSYSESVKQVDETIERIRKENQTLLDDAIDFARGVGHTIKELGKLLVKVVRKAVDVIGKILAHPSTFLKNLIGAAKTGFANFGRHIVTHLQEALLALFADSVKDVPMPKSLTDWRGLLELVLAIAGVTWAKLRGDIKDRYGEELVVKLEEAGSFVSTLAGDTDADAEDAAEPAAGEHHGGLAGLVATIRKDGIGAAWEWVKDEGKSLLGDMIDTAESWVKTRLLVAGLSALAKLLTPASAFIEACHMIKKIFDFIVDRARQIVDFVDAVLDSLQEIVEGKIERAAKAVENALTKALTLVLALLAELADLGGVIDKVKSIASGIGSKLRKVIMAVLNPVLRAGKRLLDRAARRARRKESAGQGEGKPGPQQEPGEAGPPSDKLPEREFDADDEDHEHHRLWWKEEVGHRVLMMSSTTTEHVSALLDTIETKLPKTQGKLKPERETLLKAARVALEEIARLEGVIDRKASTPGARLDARSKLIEQEGVITEKLKKLIAGTTLRRAKERYQYEGRVGTYSQADAFAGVGDKLTADHQPAYKVLKIASGLKSKTGKALFASGDALRKKYLSGSHGDGALTILLASRRHIAGQTYGSKVHPIAEKWETAMKVAIKAASGGRRDEAAGVRKVLIKAAASDAKAMDEAVTSDYRSYDGKIWDDLWDLNFKADEQDDRVKEMAEAIRKAIGQGEARIRWQTFADIGPATDEG